MRFTCIWTRHCRSIRTGDAVIAPHTGAYRGGPGAGSLHSGTYFRMTASKLGRWKDSSGNPPCLNAAYEVSVWYVLQVRPKGRIEGDKYGHLDSVDTSDYTCM